MGRKAGVSAEETKEHLLRSAARVFALRGYVGATISDISTEAKLSTGSIYAHYDGKASLFLAVLEAHGRSELGRHLQEEGTVDIAQFLIYAGSHLDDRPVAERTLLIEAIMAAKHDSDVRAALSNWFAEQQKLMSFSLRTAQKSGLLRPDFSPAAAARFAAAVSLGSLLLDVLDMPSPSKKDWADTVRHAVGAFQNDPDGALEAKTSTVKVGNSRRRS